MSRNVVGSSCVVSCLLLLAGCGHDHVVCSSGDRVIGSGVVANESRSVPPFRELSVSGPFVVSMAVGPAESVQLTAEDNVLPRIRTEVRSGRLRVFLTDGSLTTHREMRVRLTSPALEEVEGASAAQIDVADLAAESLKTRLSGASSLTVAGRADSHDLALSGASRLRGRGLQSRVVTSELSGASYAMVAAQDALSVRASGASTLEYTGDPTLTLDLSGTSVVRRIDR